MAEEGKKMGLLAVAKRMAIDWVNSLTSIEELVYVMPKTAFEPEFANGPRLEKIREVVGDDPITPEVVVSPKKRGDGQVRKKAGDLTNEKRAVILEKVGDMELKGKLYEKVREALCRELGLNRRQVTKFVQERRKVVSGTSHIGLARAAKTAKGPRSAKRKVVKKK